MKEKKNKKKKSNKIQGVVNDFKSFINRGNIIDMATGIIIGSAFTAIVSSLVNDIVMPLISSLINYDISKAKLVLRDAIYDGETLLKAEIALKYGNFIQMIINFLIIALAIFFAVRMVSKIKTTYIKHQIKYIKKLKKRFPTLFDEETEYGTILYEKLKKKYPEYFKNEITQAIDEEEKKAKEPDPLVVNNELLKKLNENLEKLQQK